MAGVYCTNTISSIDPPPARQSSIHAVETQTYLLNIKSRTDIYEDLLPICQSTLHVQRAGQWNQDLIATVGTLLLGTGDAIVDRANAVAELGLGSAKFGVRRGKVLQLGGEAGLQGAQLWDGQGGQVYWVPRWSR